MTKYALQNMTRRIPVFITRDDKKSMLFMDGLSKEVVFRDAILPTFCGFPDFSSVQCENEVRFSLFPMIIFTF